MSCCLPRKYTVVYSIGMAYIFGFGQVWFPRKVHKGNGLRCWGCLGREGWFDYSGKIMVLVDRAECTIKRLWYLWWFIFILNTSTSPPSHPLEENTSSDFPLKLQLYGLFLLNTCVQLGFCINNCPHR